MGAGLSGIVFGSLYRRDRKLLNDLLRRADAVLAEETWDVSKNTRDRRSTDAV